MMQFQNPLYEGRLIQRYKRFLADIELADGKIITAHCPNSGAMVGIKDPGLRVWVSKKEEPTLRKYPYTWEICESDETLVGVNTMLPNQLVHEALVLKAIPELESYTKIRREVKYGENSRIDFLLEGEGLPPCYLEIKNVHLKRQSFAEFPDCVTERGAKHLLELGRMVQQGARAVVMYIVQRQDCDGFAIAADLDQKYWAASQSASLQGVEQLCYQCKIDLNEIVVDKSLPFYQPRF